MKRILAPLLTALASPLCAQTQSGPEQIEQVEPEAGEWQLQYSGSYGGADSHELEIGHGIGRHWAAGLGLEVEAVDHHLELDGMSAVALLRLAEPQRSPVGLALMGQVALDRAGRLAGAELRGIAESRSARWWIQANLMLRQRREQGATGTNVAYAASIQRGPAPFWYGVEVSGRAFRLGGDDDAASARQHYIGPSLTYRVERSALELGFAWMQRIVSRGAPSGPRAFVQLDF